jgi:hypothetical protein
VAGTVSCNGSKLVTCKADGTGITETVCEFGCDAAANPNACKQAACAANEKRCNPSEAKQVQVCKPDRTGWNNGSLCPGTCLNGECQAPPSCVAGEQTCRPNVITGGVRTDVIDECTAGGTWQQGKVTCTDGDCVDQGGTPKKYACGTCWKGTRSCDSSGTPEVVLSCDDPMTGWTSAYDCWDTDWCIYGSCATPLEMAATKADNIKLLAQSFLQCWYWYMDGDVTKDEMCYIIDGSNQAQPVSFDDVSSWVCDTATSADFAAFSPDWAPTPDDAFTLVKDLVGCGFWNNSEITWKWDPLPASTFLDACMWYRPSNSALFDDEDYLDRCENFVQ